MIHGINITKSFTGEPVFENINFKIGGSTKAALVGKNGCGKSTLLKIIQGEITPDSGSIKIEHEKVGYIPQEFSFKEELVGEVLEKKLANSWEFYKVEKLLFDLEFTNFDQYQPTQTLSEGQKMKLKILEVLIDEPSVLLIDEPTNHLDIEGIMWFEKYVKELDKAVLMISHDRQFLNNTVDEVWEIDNKTLFRFAGNYDNYKEEKLRLVNKWNDDYERFLKHKQKLEQLLDRARTVGVSRKGGVQQVKSRIKREIDSNKKEKYVSHKMKNLEFETGITHSKLMVEFDKVSKSFGSNKVFSNLSFEIRGGEKIWMFGPNGAGKSTIIKLIVGEQKPTSGEVKIGNNMSIGYFAQKQTHLDFDKDLMSYFMEQTGCVYREVFSNLGRFLFNKDDLKKKVGNLSPGQRARFAFAIFAYKNYDMLVLDEPDNHLDIDTKEVLEESLLNYEGTLLLISHDRFFVERAGIEKVLNLKDGVLTQY